MRISDRTKAGMAVARAKGRIVGRARKVFDLGRAVAMRAEDRPISWCKITCVLKVPQSSIGKALNRVLGVHSTSTIPVLSPVANKG